MTGTVAAENDPPTLSYVWLYSDEAGVSHLKEQRLTFKPASDDPEAHALTLHRLAGTEGATFLRLPAGAFEDWHPAPRRWFLVVVQGISEVTTGDGEVRRLTPGMMMLMDDTKGKGHQTHAIGPEDHIALVIPVSQVEGLP